MVKVMQRLWMWWYTHAPNLVCLCQRAKNCISLSHSLSLSLSLSLSPLSFSLSLSLPYLQNDVGITSEKFSIVLYRPVGHLEFLEIKKKLLFMNKLVHFLLKMNKPSSYKTWCYIKSIKYIISALFWNAFDTGMLKIPHIFTILRLLSLGPMTLSTNIMV